MVHKLKKRRVVLILWNSDFQCAVERRQKVYFFFILVFRAIITLKVVRFLFVRLWLYMLYGCTNIYEYSSEIINIFIE